MGNRSDVLKAFSSLLPTRPDAPPADFYVYRLELQKYGPVYIGKGTGFRAWSHADNLLSIVKARLGGRVSTRESAVYDALLGLMVKNGWPLIISIIEQGMREQDAFMREALEIERCGRVILGSGPLFNLADGGPSVGRKYIAAKNAHKEGVNVRKALVTTRPRPGKRERRHSQRAFGAFGGLGI